METRQLVTIIALTFSVLLLVQNFELPYMYILSSFGKSQVTSKDGSVSEYKSSGNEMFSNGSDKTKLSDEKKRSNETPRDFLETETREEDARVLNLTSSIYSSSLRNISVGRVVPFKFPPLYWPSKDANRTTQIESNNRNVSSNGKNEAKAFLESDFSPSMNNSTPSNKRRFKGPPKVVVPISAMNNMLLQSYVSYRPMKPRWPSHVDQELLNAKGLIQNAEIAEKNPAIDVNVYRNYSAFKRSYELMEQTLKIYIYTEGEKPVFHQPELYGIYASEGWFMKLLEENKHFVTKDADKAHLFYLPFSSRMLEETLYVPNSHSRKNLVRYLSRYIQKITSKYRFWNRTDGADHFIVACHDWAPAETSRIMKNCIRSLCNAEVKSGFQFGKDVSLPETFIRFSQNPLENLGGYPPSERKTLAFFAGKMHGYLRPLLLKQWENKDPNMKIFGKLNESTIQNQTSNYIHYMKSSKYCISAKGYEGYTPRIVEAIYYECVPVIISDNFVPPFFETLNWESFAVFVLEKDIPNLKSILTRISEKRYLAMQGRVKLVQKHFLWHDEPVKYDVFHMILHSIWYSRVFQMGKVGE